MSKKKVVGRNIAIGLGIVCLISLSGLVGVVYYYTSAIDGKEYQLQMLTDQKNQLQIWLDGNKTSLIQVQEWLNGNASILDQMQTWLQGNITYFNSMIWALNAQIATLEEQIDVLTQRVAFYDWVDGSNATYVDLLYNLYPNTTVTDANATYGIKNGASSDREISIWAESCNATEWISDFRIEILDSNGFPKITVPILTSFDNVSVLYVARVGWSQPPNTIFTMRVSITCKATVVPDICVQAQLGLESRIFPHP